MEATRDNIKQSAITTLIEIWDCIDWDSMDSRRIYGIWDEFSSKIKASAMTTNSYEKFIEKLCRKMDIRSLRFGQINELQKQSNEFKKQILKILREETLGIVLEVRLNNQIRKEQAQLLKKKNKIGGKENEN